MARAEAAGVALEQAATTRRRSGPSPRGVSYWPARGWIESDRLAVLRLPDRAVRLRPAALGPFRERERRP